MKEIFDQGVAASKEFAVKAGAKAHELSEMGILMLEIKQLESHAQKLIGRLGNEAYDVFVEQKMKSLSISRAQVKIILEELAKARESIEKKEAELKNKKKN
jgi:hypothetical protein